MEQKRPSISTKLEHHNSPLCHSLPPLPPKCPASLQTHFTNRRRVVKDFYIHPQPRTGNLHAHARSSADTLHGHGGESALYRFKGEEDELRVRVTCGVRAQPDFKLSYDRHMGGSHTRHVPMLRPRSGSLAIKSRSDRKRLALRNRR
ncbi:hypothetical protein ZIOFF_013746 [Zingiber officinale]|uniref:Uncharacterized protein n=1 Tax=Zingiber officinale TaxID=94328 RepID=A0A8J5LQP8_ZINOF|nr:hypothetical protein ZIOFF_013746 [Zingiber officinale]